MWICGSCPRSGPAGRRRPGDPARNESDPGRSGLPARPGMGRRSGGARPARRPGAGRLRGLSDAGASGGGSRRRRGASRIGHGARPAGCRYGADRREAPAAGDGHAERRGVPGLRDARRADDRRGAALPHPGRGSDEGARSADGRIAGSYVHGLFAAAPARAAFLAEFGATSRIGDYDAIVDAALDEIAEVLAGAFDIGALARIAGLPAAGAPE